MSAVRPTPPQPRSWLNPHGLPYGRVGLFLLCFAALILFVSYDYLFPALEAVGRANKVWGSDADRQKGLILLSAQSRLILCLVLFVILALLLLTFPIGKYFFPRSRKRAEPTKYPDAWAESARRLKVDDDDSVN